MNPESIELRYVVAVRPDTGSRLWFELDEPVRLDDVSRDLTSLPGLHGWVPMFYTNKSPAESGIK